jgi:hypothetical protein
MGCGSAVRLEARLCAPLPQHQGRRVRARRLQDARDVQGDKHAPPSSRGPGAMPGRAALRSAAAAARPQRRPPVCEAAASRRFPRSERRSPDDLPQPARTGRPEALASGPPAASPYPILRGVSRRLWAALLLAAHCGSGRGATDGARPVCPLPSSRPAYAMAPVRQQGRRRRPRLRQDGTIHCGRTPLVCDSAHMLAMCSSSRLAEKLCMPSPLTSESLENARASSRPTHAHIYRLHPTTNAEKLSKHL